ncbi:ABC transporter ATP-binding protein [Microbacterium stercoris]|uniref:ABC transporter ATP-binding protein n=1 Tax=Microbacterium stercoris TaxID=2820289 RepID=A0A939TX11_9MICO|nr:ABC transporter ATP-binding protein [Microbacterium stercoris]MBO3663197.1 ABC transporter ATP-binding protein [Microbacterium stercoris]
MSDVSETRSRRSPFARPTKDDGPRATLKQLLPFVFEHKRTLVWVSVLSVLAAVATLVQPLLIGQVIERVQAGEALGLLVWALVGFVVVSSAISAYQHFLLQRTGTAVVLSSRRRLIARILHLPISEFDARRTGDLVSRVGTDTTMLYAVLTQGLADSVGGVLIFVGALIAMLLIDPILLCAIVGVLGLSVLAVVSLSGRMRRATARQQTLVGELTSGIERAIGAVRTIRAAGATAREERAVTTKATEAYDAGVEVAKASALVVPIAGVALQASMLVVLGVGGMRVASGAVAVSSLVTFVMFLLLLVMPLGQAFGAIASVGQALGALGRIQEVLDLPTEDAQDQGARPVAPVAGAPAIAFRDVRFRYPEAAVAARAQAESEAHVPLDETTTTDDVLRGVTFEVPRGSRVALVGPSGAGKSTILALLERFYDPTAGVIELDGQDARELSRDDLRSRFGYVEQDAPTLAGTIADNLRLASPDATAADCERVLRAVNLGSVIDRSPLGIDTPVGEDGVMLSGGERQRLAIARALLAAPPILLLDESTSSLDGLNEQLMRDAIDAVAEGRTLIVIAHRLSTVIDSDRIVVLEKGQVVGQGTHGELVASTPLYRDLARHQLLV